MARYRIVGIVCDVINCDNEHQLIGGVTHSDVELDAYRNHRWSIVGRGVRGKHYCPDHFQESMS